MLKLTRQLTLVCALGLIALPSFAAEQAQQPVAVKADNQQSVEKKAEEAKPEACKFKISLS